MKFKNYIETESGIKDTSSEPGTAGQVLSSTVTGTSWIGQKEITAGSATVVTIECKNTHTTPLTKGTPVYQTGTVGATDVIEIAPGNALVSTGAQPSIGLLQQDLAINEFGYVIITGELLNITTDPIDGLTPVTGQKVFVKSGGGLTLTKPTTELNSIQNMGLVGKVSGGNAGSITVSSIMRTNDVPNLPTGRIWIGDGNTIVSDTVYVDEPNGRVGIGTSSPNSSLEVAGEIDSVGGDGYLVEGVRWARGSGGLLQLGDWSGLGYNTSIFGSNGALAIRTSGGNVGIGTTNPQAKLHVANGTLRTWTPTSGTSAIFESTANNRNFVTITAANEAELWFGDATTQAKGRIRYEISDGLLNFERMEFWTNAIERMVIDGSGKLGIGVENPQEKMHLSGSSNVRLEVEATDSTVAALKLTNTAGSYGSFVNASGSLNTYDYNAASVRTTLLTNGDFGIGTTTPSAKLDVVQATAANGAAALHLIGPNTNAGLTSSVLIIEQGDGKKITMDGNDIDVSSGDLFINDYSLEDVTFGGQIKVKGSGSPVGDSYIANGNFGIGNTIPQAKLHVEDATPKLKILSNQYYNSSIIEMGNGANPTAGLITCSNNPGVSALELLYDNGATGDARIRVGQRYLDFQIDAISTMYINSLKYVGIGTTNPAQKLHVVGRVASTAGNGFEIINSYGSPRLSDFYGSFTTTAPLYVGSPYAGQACYASAFNITSDYRLKENEAPLTEASSRIKKLKPIRFNYISSENTVDGFLAHEVAEVIPEAVTGEKDAVREDGSDELQGLDLSKIVPVLTAALQESIKKIEQLEQRIKKLENK